MSRMKSKTVSGTESGTESRMKSRRSTPPIVAANWKMHKTPHEGAAFVTAATNMLLDMPRTQVIFCPPFPALIQVQNVLADSPFGLGAQNVHWEPQGAFTGEVSTAMLRACGVGYVIIGHSERRHIFGEKDKWINKKLRAVLEEGLTPICCIGETLPEREKGRTAAVLESQLQLGLEGLETSQAASLIMAYEPVWAIGTGVVASRIQVQEAHLQVREVLGRLYSTTLAQQVPILYGGSVKPQNAAELIGTPGVDGFLIGGASLQVDSFVEITSMVEKNYLRE